MCAAANVAASAREALGMPADLAIDLLIATAELKKGTGRTGRGFEQRADGTVARSVGSLEELKGFLTRT